jgi:hypothetical protein
MSSVMGRGEVRAASSRDLHSTSGGAPGSRRRVHGDAVLAEQLVAGGPRPARRCRAARGRRHRGRSRGSGRWPGVEHQERPGGPQGPDVLARARARRRGGRRRRSAGARLGVEQHDAQRDELLAAVERRHLPVQLLEGLGRVAVLAEEHPQEVLGLEGGDRRLDAVAGDVADDRGQAGGGGRGTRRRSRRPSGRSRPGRPVPTSKPGNSGSSSGARRSAQRLGARSSWVRTSWARRSSSKRLSARRESAGPAALRRRLRRRRWQLPGAASGARPRAAGRRARAGSGRPRRPRRPSR